MRTVLVTTGSWGDINPFVSIALEAISAGHQVVLITERAYTDRLAHLLSNAPIELIGFESGVDPDLPLNRPDVMDRWRGTGVFLREVLEPSLEPMYRSVLDAIHASPTDVVVCHHVCFSAAWAARTAGIPFITAALAPASWMSLENPNQYPVMPDRDHYRRPLLVAGNTLGRIAMRSLVDPIANRVRSRLGLPKLRDVMLTDMFQGSANLAMWSPAFRPPASDDPPRSTICGFPFLDPPDGIDPDLDTFLEAGDPPVLFTLGSLTGTMPSPFASIAAEACRRLSCRGLIIIGHTQSIPSDLPDTVLARPWVSYHHVMHRSLAIVHHAGVGTTAQTLRAGRPAIAIPFAHDQFDNARRARLLGASRTLDRKKLTADTLTDALRSLLADPDYERAAQSVGKQIRTEHATRRAIEIIESVVTSTTPDALPHALATSDAR